jgi:DNA-binding GntR family transcriptional regulator
MSESAGATRLHRPSVVDALADALRARVLSGDLAPGAAMREAALSTEYDLSRHTLRAALTALEVEACRLTLERNAGKLPAAVHTALDALVRLCRSKGSSWHEIADAHARFHHHRSLVDDLESRADLDALRRHLADGLEAVAEQRDAATHPVAGS